MHLVISVIFIVILRIPRGLLRQKDSMKKDLSR